ncbi:hypothetical protein ALC57_07652 [Trachymyrmex cornetzi]|uniref:Tyr recombinase domain-containing protein n=1 Tax=Trachymyrmex cornetzi TaxID=471704 RepID=A0A151J7L8_9HYME|nr:hypothetical protein ALC57_07652 [Trachymyrmex cornetzi]
MPKSNVVRLIGLVSQREVKVSSYYCRQRTTVGHVPSWNLCDPSRPWDLCAKRNLFIYAPYISSAQNTEADTASRIVSKESEWTLIQHYFPRIKDTFITISLISTNEVGTLLLGKRFLKGVAVLKPQRHCYDYQQLKTPGVRGSQPLLSFKLFLEGPERCIVSLVKSYIRFTIIFATRNATPYNAASSQILARWVKLELSPARMDTNTFSAHSTRHASTSLVALSISLEEFRRSAGWTKPSDTFARFYNRPIIRNLPFQSAILNRPHHI